ncbi:MAG: sugar ABC transporter ATP-binding protein [Alphaproteobacteria bacterium]|nr:sugar ABC transporter ATP-binding protein [Alphaproteobacteria bacterium]
MDRVLTVEAVSKRFGGTQALARVSLELPPGRVHALVGENGAGKSTLIRILGGITTLDEGRILLDGRPVEFGSPREAAAAGLGVVSQDVRVVPRLSVAENVMLGQLPMRRALGLVPVLDRAAVRASARAVLGRLNFRPDLDAPAGDLPYSERQLIAIARALSRNLRILILDEPTAALERREVGRLFETIRALAAEGVAILFVSHRLDEVVEIADDCTVLRDGAVVAHASRGGFDAEGLIRQMTGRDLEELHRPHDRELGPAALELPSGTLRAHTREIVGLAGLLGAGTTPLLRRLFGAAGRAAVRLRGHEATIRHPADAIRAGMGLVPGERAHGLVLGMSVRDNIVLPNLERLAGRFRFDAPAIDQLVGRLMEALDIRPRDPQCPVRELSGGNQQKVIFAKWLAAEANLLLLDEPTQGIDVGAKAQIHRLMHDVAARGGAIVFASSELHEVMAMSDAVLAMRRGDIVARMDRSSDYTERALRAALGG